MENHLRVKPAHLAGAIIMAWNWNAANQIESELTQTATEHTNKISVGGNNLRHHIDIPLDVIHMDERGVAYIVGTRMKVKHIALASIHGASIPEIKSSYPHLSLLQIQSALDYYSVNRERIDEQIAADDRYVEDMRGKATNQITLEELRRRKKQA